MRMPAIDAKNRQMGPKFTVPVLLSVFGVFFGYHTEPYKVQNVATLKAQLRPLCDIESEELAIRSLVAQKLAETDKQDECAK